MALDDIWVMVVIITIQLSVIGVVISGGISEVSKKLDEVIRLLNVKK